MSCLVTERTPPPSPCFPSPCGPNAECRERNGAGSCACLSGYEGNPYDQQLGCKRECEVNSDCLAQLACVSFKCVDPCPGTCGSLAECRVNNHIPTCVCPAGFTGDPFFQCREIPPTRKYTGTWAASPKADHGFCLSSSAADQPMPAVSVRTQQSVQGSQQQRGVLVPPELQRQPSELPSGMHRQLRVLPEPSLH